MAVLGVSSKTFVMYITIEKARKNAYIFQKVGQDQGQSPS